jgi:hypothetical protein
VELDLPLPPAGFHLENQLVGQFRMQPAGTGDTCNCDQ